MANRYMVSTGGNPTTAAPSKVAISANTIKTLLQIATPSNKDIYIIEYGLSFDGSTANAPGQVELLTTGAIAATVTSRTPNLYGDVNGPASLCVGGTSATGDNASAEGTIVSTTEYDLQLVAPTNQFIHQFPLGREPHIPVSAFLRLRATFANAVNVYAYIIWEE